MAKYKGITGTKEGKLGNEVYYISKTQNLVRSYPAKVYNPRTPKQMIRRIKMANCNNGYRDLGAFKKFNSFTDAKPVESLQNTYIRHNIESALLVPKPLCKKKNCPIFTLNNVVSTGMGAIPLVDDNEGNNWILGVSGGVISDDVENMTVGQVSTILKFIYPDLQNNDIVVCQIHGVTNINWDDNDGLVFDDDEELRKYSLRRILTIDSSKQDTLVSQGWKLYKKEDNSITLTPIITVPEYSGMILSDWNGISYANYQFILSRGGQMNNVFGFSSMTYNYSYRQICRMFANNVEVQNQILKEWKTNFKYNKE